MDGGSSAARRMGAPVDVLEAAISRVVEAANAGAPAPVPVPAGVPQFIASKAFYGAKPGYYFSAGDRGIG